MLHARYVLCVSAGPRYCAILWRLRVLCGWRGGGCLPWLRRAAFVRCPTLRPPCCRSLGQTGCAAHCAAVRAGVALVLFLVPLWHCYWALEPTPAPAPFEALWGYSILEQFYSSSRSVVGSNFGGGAALSLRHMGNASREGRMFKHVLKSPLCAMWFAPA